MAQAEISKPEISETPFMLYSWLCPYVQRVALACSAKHVSRSEKRRHVSGQPDAIQAHDTWPIKEVEIDLLNKPSWFLDISPHGKVPVIVFKEAGKTQVLYESLVLLDYVEDRLCGQGPSLLPEGATQRALARIIIGRFDSKTVPLFYKILRETDKAASHALAAEIHSELEWIQENLAEEGPFFMGKQFTNVDAAVLPWLLRSFLLVHYRGYDMLKGFDRLRSYVDAASKSSVVASTYKPPEGKDWTEEMKAVYMPYGGTPIDLYN